MLLIFTGRSVKVTYGIGGSGPKLPFQPTSPPGYDEKKYFTPVVSG
jgi:hypothetical protein